jgi:transcription antitermination protein NusB
MLFSLETSGERPEEVIALFWANFEGDPEGREYANEVVRGVAENAGEIDARVTKASEHWRLERMSKVDRNLLRLATWELLHKVEVPRAVVLDEAVELAKAYGAEESKAFVNGVLTKVADEAGRYDPDH